MKRFIRYITFLIFQSKVFPFKGFLRKMMESKLRSDCIFCRIVDGKESAEIIYENEHAISILDVNPVNFGHALVIPRNHYEDFLHLPEQEYGAILKAIKIVAQGVVNGIEPKPEGFNILSNNGFVAGQRIFHVHFHIIPRYLGDGLKFKPVIKRYARGEMSKYAELIRRKINEIKN